VLFRSIEGAHAVLGTLRGVSDQREAMQLLTLKEGERRAYARAALELRYDEADKAPIEPERLLSVRRHAELEDQTTLWRTFNVVQENAVRGGIRGRDAGN